MIVDCHVNLWEPEHLRPLFLSLLANTREPYRVILVEDCSTDPAVAGLIEEFAPSFKEITLLRHEENRGFIASVNELETGVGIAAGSAIPFPFTFFRLSAAGECARTPTTLSATFHAPPRCARSTW